MSVSNYINEFGNVHYYRHKTLFAYILGNNNHFDVYRWYKQGWALTN